MEFKYRSGDRGDFSSSSSSSFSLSSTGYFAEQALQAGIVPSTKSRTEALIHELRKERFREEILAREIAHKRMLEEELLRELELERRREMISFQNEAFSPLKMESRLRERSEPRFEKPLASRRAIVEKLGLDKVPWPSETSGSKDNKLRDQKVSGIKRKAAIEPPQLPQKEWSCSLCQVSANSQKNWNAHLRGKKHKVKEGQLMDNKAVFNNSNNVPLNQLEEDVEGKKQECIKQQLGTLWCVPCKVRCNTPAMLDSHLNGKKHKARMVSRKGAAVAGNATTRTTEVVKEVTDQKEKREEEEEVKPEEDDAKVQSAEAAYVTLASSWECYFQ